MNIRLDGLSQFLNLIKFGAFIFNLIFFILACFLLKISYESLHNPIFEPISIDKTFIYMSIIISITVVFISLLGCFGTFIENYFVLKYYAYLILFCIFLQASVFFMISRINIDEITDTFRQEYIEKYDQDKQEIKDFIDSLQSNNKCCGINNHEDYKGKVLSELPKSCCDTDDSKFCTPQNLHKKNCKAPILELFKANKKSLNVVLSLILILQLSIIIVTCVLGKSLENIRLFNK